LCTSVSLFLFPFTVLFLFIAISILPHLTHNCCTLKSRNFILLSCEAPYGPYESNFSRLHIAVFVSCYQVQFTYIRVTREFYMAGFLDFVHLPMFFSEVDQFPS
jgi:hypothetical protein